ncbi:MAG: UDP-galactopyranose mutase [Rhodospirillales bacterium]|nr:UDP-galactopyranose mutase [Rhodospirillales bacterium]
MGLFEGADLIVVGAGFFGATVAERAAAAGFRVVVLDRRGHVGGNAYTYTDAATGIEVHRYGPHIFHTSSAEVVDYLSAFTSWVPYEHRVWTTAGGRVFPLPINLATISLFNGRLMAPGEARAWVAERAGGFAAPANLEEKAISLVGRPLYEAFIRGYTQKQWQTDPTRLPASIITRLPVRYNFDNRYFNDTFQQMPEHGYTAIFERMLAGANIAVHLGVDWFAVRAAAPDLPVVYTGPIDRYFDERLGRLGWRTIDFAHEVHDGDFQGCAVMNYADADVAWTRIAEFKHFASWRGEFQKTIIAREYSRFAGAADEPYYPIDLAEDRARYDAYRALAAAEKRVVFGGRLGTYRYLDMHQAIGAALRAWEREVRPLLAG